MDEADRLLAELTRALVRGRTSGPMSVRMCRALSEVVAADGGSISMGATPPERVVVCATDGSAAGFEDAQDVFREGPVFDALVTGSPVSGLSLADQRKRWPLLLERLEAQGAPVTLHAFPVRPDSTTLGAVSVYQVGDRSLGGTAAAAQFLANAGGVALLGPLGPGAVSHETWATRDRVDQATGMVVAQLKVSPEDALAVLRAHAFVNGSTLAEVSARVVQRELDFGTADGREDRSLP